MSLTDPDRLFPVEPHLRDQARALYHSVRDLPIISPHGHCDPRWFAENARFPNPAELFVVPDHYVFRMLASQGVHLSDLGVPRSDGGPTETDPRAIWRRFAENFHLFRATAVRDVAEPFLRACVRPDHALVGGHRRCLLRPYRGQGWPMTPFAHAPCLSASTSRRWPPPKRALDDLRWHHQMRDSGWQGRVVTTYRPDAVVDPEFEGFAQNVATLGEITGEDTATWAGYLNAHRARRGVFQGSSAPRPATMATPRRAPRTCPTPRRPRCSTPSSPARRHPKMRTSFAGRC